MSKLEFFASRIPPLLPFIFWHFISSNNETIFVIVTNLVDVVVFVFVVITFQFDN